MPSKKATSVQLSIDLDKLIREEATEWFTANRSGLEVVFHRVADRVREELEIEINALRDRVRELEEESKRLRSVLTMVRSQVVEDAMARD